jgi:hypothetical protein
MSARLATAVWAALLAGLASVVMLTAASLFFPTLRIDFALDPPRFVSGVYPAERDEATGLTFAWTGPDAAIRLPGLDRRVAWTVEVRLRAARQNPEDNPIVVFFVDGVRVLEHKSETVFTTVTLQIPPRQERPRGALIGMQSAPTFVPGPSDRRSLGVMLDVITMRPEGRALPPWDAFAAAATSGAVLAAAIALLGVAPILAIGGAVLLAGGQTALLARGFGPYTDFPDTVTRLAIAVGIGLVAITTAAERIQNKALRNPARFAAAFTAAALFLKLLVLLHPDMPIGDAMFQAHRFQAVLGGSYFFTSIAPGNYLFPYAPGLYVAASPFARFVQGEAGNVILLRVVVAATDAAVAALLYVVVARSWDDRRAAAIATALYQLLPLDFLIASGGTLTNAFAQSLAVAASAVVAAPWVRLERPVSVVLLIVTLLAAFLSHTSTFAILSVTAAAVAVMFAWRGGRALRSPALAVAVACVAAAALAVLIYYAHFIDTYRTEFARISAETVSAAPDAGNRTIADRAAIVPEYLRLYFGWPALVLAAVGAGHLWRQRARDRLSLTLTGWALTCGLFLLLGVLTPVDMRYYVAALPAMAIAAATAASRWWDAGGARRMATAVLLAWATWIGVGTWFGALR